MKRFEFTILCTVALLIAGAAAAQTGHMSSDSAWGSGWMAGYGVIWVPLLLVLIAVGVFTLVVERTGK